ncbi:MAG: DNA polymerase III subunit chi [Pseudomonadota bacterium]
MTEILFYHLTERTLEQVLPGLVEKSLQRSWKVVVQAGSPERVEALDGLLWTYRDESFLPHSSIRDGDENLQPVWLTTDTDNPNSAGIRFLVDGADLDEIDGYERLVYIFDGHDNSSVEHARTRWKFHKEQEGHDQTYWQQNPNGGWDKKA